MASKIRTDPDNPYRSPETLGVQLADHRVLLHNVTLGKVCALVVLTSAVGVVAGITVTLIIWATQEVHPADKWFIFCVYAEVGAFGGFVGGCVWCATLLLRQRWRSPPTPRSR